MSIQYAVVLRDKKVILAEYTEFSGNFRSVALELFPKLKASGKQTYENQE